MSSFEERFVALFEAEFHRLFRYLDRLSGEPDLAADLAQEAFIRLHQRGTMPEHPGSWLVTVALNLFRNARTMSSRRHRLLTVARAQAVLSDPAPIPEETQGASSYEKVWAALGQLNEREKQMLLLRAEGYSYSDIASVLDLNEGSIGTLLARAKRRFREAFEELPDAP